MNESWNQIRERIEQFWSDVEFDERELRGTRGSLSKMVNLIHEKTGEPPAEIRRTVSALI